jgi:protein TonB
MPNITVTRGLVRPAVLALFALATVLPRLAAAGDAALVTRVEPEFPREALQAGTQKGHVKARMTLDRSGEVIRVEILEANPRRLFDRAVVKSLSQWRYDPGENGRNVEIDIEFKR